MTNAGGSGAPPLRLAVIGDGTSVNVQRWCQSLASAGAEVHLLTFGRDLPVPDGYTHHVLRPGGPRQLRYYLAAPSARRILRRLRPDVVVGYFATGFGTLARLTGRRPLVEVAVGSDVLHTPHGSPAGRAARRNLATADLVLAWSDQLGAAAEALGARPDTVVVRPRGIPIDRFLLEGRPIPEHGGRVITTRALRPHYRHDLLLGGIAAAGKDLTLTVIGEGPLRAPLEDLAEDLGIASRVTFTGAVANDDLPSLLGEHDIYASLAPTDGVSASLLEAMASGLLPVVPDIEAHRGWLEEGVGVRLGDTDPGALGEALDTIARQRDLRERAARTNPAIAAARADMSVLGRRFVEDFRALATSS